MLQALGRMQRRIIRNTRYFGIPCTKSPMDMWVYREIIFRQKPDFIIEIGCGRGSSSLALAHTMDIVNHGEICAIDLSLKRFNREARNHSRIFPFEGEACELFETIQGTVAHNIFKKHPLSVMIIEDSSHTYENTINVLRTYSPLVTKDYYFIVEDTNGKFGIGNMTGAFEAVEDFIKENDNFEIDHSQESFFLTWNPSGYLRRIK
jgi:cephalosporin hydroxylase